MPNSRAALIFLLLAASPALAAEGDWRGPLPIRDQFPLEMIALDFTPRHEQLALLTFNLRPRDI